MGTRRQTSLIQDIGNSGLEKTYGRIEDDFLREWNGEEKVKRIKQMTMNSPVIGAAILAVELQIRDIDWMFMSEAGENDPRIELANAALKNLDFDAHLAAALNAAWYGWEVMTITWERTPDGVLWKRFKELGHDTIMRWLYEGNEELVGLQQWPHLWREPIPLNRMIHYRIRAPLDSPEGKSLLRPAWLPFYYATGLQEIEAIGIERNLAGLPVITPPMGTNTDDGSDDMTLANQIVRNVRNDEQGGLVLPPPMGEGDHMRWRFELLSSAGVSKAIDTNIVISRYEKRILMSFLAQFLMLGMDSVGALATFEGGNDFFNAAINAIADTIAKQFTDQALKPLMEMNGHDPNGIMLTHTPAGDMELDLLGSFLQAVSGFITFTPEDEVAIRAMARLPEKSVDEIKAAKEEKKREDREMAAMLRPQPQPGQNMPGGRPGQQMPMRDDGDDMPMRDDNAATWYAISADTVAGNAPDDADRLAMERTWYDKAVTFFTGQQKRVVRSLKDMSK